MKKENDLSKIIVYKTLREHTSQIKEINEKYTNMEDRIDAKFDMVINEIFELRNEVRILVKNISEWRNN